MTHLEELFERYPVLAPCKASITTAIKALGDCYAMGGTLLVCGNGGSAADADHIVGELMKSFLIPRPLPEGLYGSLQEADSTLGQVLADKLQGALPAINLGAGSTLLSAFGNDVGPDLAYAQAVVGYGKPGDLLLGISTSGNAVNVRNALCAARAVGMTTLCLTGADGGKMAGMCDIAIKVPATRTFEVQELHLPVYHCICASVEARFFS
jgi:D-sedoheptulose 7-phosphate isomerase